MGVGSSPLLRVHGKKAIAVHDVTPPVQNQWYTILDTTENVVLYLHQER